MVKENLNGNSRLESRSGNGGIRVDGVVYGAGAAGWCEAWGWEGWGEDMSRTKSLKMTIPHMT